MKHLCATLLTFLFLLPCLAMADCPVYFDLSDAEAQKLFQADTPILEIVFPSIAGCDACILRMGDEVLMIDAAYDSMTETGVIAALKAMDISHIQTAFVTHPHDDHVRGFFVLCREGYTFDRMYLCFDENANGHSIRAVRAMRESGAEILSIEDGEVLTLGQASLTMIQRKGPSFTVNDLSGLLRVQYGDAVYLATGDIENRAQAALATDPPVCTLKADIMKHPHHGYAKMDDHFLELVAPQYVIVTGMRNHIADATSYLDRIGIRWERPWQHPIRMRTDGHIWVIDHLPGA